MVARQARGVDPGRVVRLAQTLAREIERPVTVPLIRPRVDRVRLGHAEASNFFVNSIELAKRESVCRLVGSAPSVERIQAQDLVCLSGGSPSRVFIRPCAIRGGSGFGGGNCLRPRKPLSCNRFSARGAPTHQSAYNEVLACAMQCNDLG